MNKRSLKFCFLLYLIKKSFFEKFHLYSNSHQTSTPFIARSKRIIEEIKGFILLSLCFVQDSLLFQNCQHQQKMHYLSSNYLMHGHFKLFHQEEKNTKAVNLFQLPLSVIHKCQPLRKQKQCLIFLLCHLLLHHLHQTRIPKKILINGKQSIMFFNTEQRSFVEEEMEHVYHQ